MRTLRLLFSLGVLSLGLIPATTARANPIPCETLHHQVDNATVTLEIQEACPGQADPDWVITATRDNEPVELDWVWDWEHGDPPVTITAVDPNVTPGEYHYRVTIVGGEYDIVLDDWVVVGGGDPSVDAGVPPADADVPKDDAGNGDDPPGKNPDEEAAGCSVTRGGTPQALLLFIGCLLLVVRRRRKPTR